MSVWFSLYFERNSVSSWYFAIIPWIPSALNTDSDRVEMVENSKPPPPLGAKADKTHKNHPLALSATQTVHHLGNSLFCETNKFVISDSNFKLFWGPLELSWWYFQNVEVIQKCHRWQKSRSCLGEVWIDIERCDLFYDYCEPFAFCLLSHLK